MWRCDSSYAQCGVLDNNMPHQINTQILINSAFTMCSTEEPRRHAFGALLSLNKVDMLERIFGRSIAATVLGSHPYTSTNTTHIL